MSLPRLEAAFKALRSLDGLVVSAGIQSDEGQETLDGPQTLAEVATDLHFGVVASGEGNDANMDGWFIPPRPWLQVAFDKRSKRWARLAGKVPRARRKGGGYVELQQLAAAMVGDCQESLLDEPWAPNAPLTIELKGSDQPLVDTGRLNQSHRAVIQFPDDGERIVVNGIA